MRLHHVVRTVLYQYGSVDLEEQKLGRRIAEALEAAQHGDEQAVHNLRSELKAEQERTDKLLTSVGIRSPNLTPT